MSGAPEEHRWIRIALALILLGLTISIPYISSQREREYWISPLFQTSPMELPFGYPPLPPVGLEGNPLLPLEVPAYPRLDRPQIFLPIVVVTYECTDRLYSFLKNDSEQQRPVVRCNSRLGKAAQAKALDMVTRGYFSHITPDRETANEWARRHGCILPDIYPEKGNTIESIGLNYHTAEAMWKAFKESPGHRMHVLGEADTYRDQTEIGIGYAESPWGKVYVVFTSASC